MARRADLAFCPLDSEYYPRVFKFGTDEARFRHRLFWRDRSVTEAGRRYRIATPLLSCRLPDATPPTCPPHLRSDRCGWEGHERLAGLKASNVALDVAAMFLEIQLRVCDAHSIMIAVLHVVFSILSELSCFRAVRAW